MRAWVARHAPHIRPFKLRIRDGLRDGEVYACVSTKYVDYGLDLVAQDLVVALEDIEGLRATIDYDGRRVLIDANAFTGVEPSRFVKGEVFGVGCRVSSWDDGTGSAKGGGTAERAVCLNMAIVAALKSGGFSVAHRGTREAFRRDLRDGFDAASAAAAHFVREWGGDAQVADLRGNVRPEDGEATVPEGADGYSLSQLFWGVFLAEQRRGTVPVGLREIAPIMAAWGVEPEPSRKGLVNALTRYAHEGQGDAWHADDIERAAVGLLVSKRPLEWADPSALQRRA
jgi:hypothetical protein